MDRATGPPAEAIAVPHQALVHNHPRTPRTTGRPPALSQAEEIGAAPAHLRRDRARAELAESFGAGRASCRPQTTRTRPGPWSWTALPCRAGTGSTSRARTRAGTTEPGPHSGRHHRTGPDLQDTCTPAGRPVRVPDPAPGSTHDTKAPQLTGLLDNPPDTPPLGDEGRIGPGMTTPVRRPPGGEPVDRQKQHNKIINSSRAPVERATARLKTWRTLHTGYRRPLHTFPQTITAVTALESFKNYFE